MMAGMSEQFSTVTSADGTTIGYERHGQGPAVVFVDGALSARGGKAGLDELLAPEFTVFRYDRRGRATAGARCLTRPSGRWRTWPR